MRVGAISRRLTGSMNIPKKGSNIPIMGIKRTESANARHVSMADALFSSTQQRVLGFLFGQPERSFFATELIGLIGAGSGVVQRELVRLEQSGLVTVSWVGTQKHYQANHAAPIFAEICSIARKTVGLVEPLREALTSIARNITAAFVFGSVAKRSDTAASDIDVLIVSDSVDYADAFAALQLAEARLGRKVNPAVYTLADWRRKRKAGNAFVTKVSAQPKMFVFGTEESLG